MVEHNMIVTLMESVELLDRNWRTLCRTYYWFFVSRKVFQSPTKENPPITEKQVRAMLAATGRKPSEAQVRAVMRSLGQ